MTRPGAGANRHLVVGLTGSSGSGKSEAAKILKGLGARLIDADEVAREVLKKREALAELVAEFGDWVVDGQGNYNRAPVSEKAFSDTGFLKRLTEITHKYIIKEIDRRMRELQAGIGGYIIVIDAPIPVERGFLDVSDYVWVVKSPREHKLGRIIARDGISPGAAKARLMSQLPDAEYEKLADEVIENNSGLDQLKCEIKKLYAKIVKDLQF